MITPTSSSRRRFLKKVAATAAVSSPIGIPALLQSASPNGKLQYAAIGCSNKGWSDLRAISSHPDCEVVALCDVDTANLAQARKTFPNARWYQDYRHMLSTEEYKIDAVSVSTPDHMHAPITLAALAIGKHVYCQKPLTHNVAEARSVQLAAKNAGVVTQMGNQIQSFSEYRTAVRWIQEGLIGKIESIHVWCGGNYAQPPRPTKADPIPETLDWDAWLGVAPARDYKQSLYHPFNWRGWRDFGGGVLGDMACHILDTPFKATGIHSPTRIRSTVDESWAGDKERLARAARPQ